MTDEPDNLDEVQRRLSEIRSRKRGRIRWNVSRHTAEIALDAILPPDRRKHTGKVGKARRRKKRKRLL